jgi:hypothetical protein
MVTVVNRRLEPEKDLSVRARVVDNRMTVLWEKAEKTDVKANAYQDVFAVPAALKLSPVYYVKLDLTADNKHVSDNFYWLSSKQPPDFGDLDRMPLVKPNATEWIEYQGAQQVAHVRIENPTDQLAFFIQLAVTKGPGGEEVLPIFWSDDYFSLLPGESKMVAATFATDDLHGANPALEVGGWNIQTPYRCDFLRPSKSIVKAGEPFQVTAGIADTFLDGSRITLYVDDQPVDSQWCWARGGTSRELVFELRLDQPGRHRILVGDRSTEVVVPCTPGSREPPTGQR